MRRTLLSLAVLLAAAFPSQAQTRPNIVFLIADDLGYGDLGCYGQTKIKTPNLDRLAKAGMRFTTAYSGHNVCAPSRCVLMTGKHPGHAYIRTNQKASGFSEGQEPVPPGTLSLPLLLKSLGYTLGGFGKWGLGPMGSTGDPLKQGFDRWYGFNCQGKAHNHYPSHLWDNDKHIALNNPAFSAHQKLPDGADPNDDKSYAQYSGKDYAPDLIAEKAREFVKTNKDRPFFLYYPTTVPHLALQVPADSLAEYAGKFPETPYTGGSYLPHKTPRAAYAAMITRMDRDIGKLLDLLDELKLTENTIIVFTSDNGAITLAGTDVAFFLSTGGLRGQKGTYYEGGFRVPSIVRWTGRIPAGSTSDRITGFEDWLPTLLELAGAKDKTPAKIDGISMVPTLFGKEQPPRPFLYRETPSGGGVQYVRVGEWAGLRTNLNPNAKSKSKEPGEFELYNLVNDPKETTNVAAQNPDVVARLRAIMEREHEPSALFPIRALDEKK